jgi:RNA polymerase sigma factor (TIGR02999 family)
MSEPAEIESRAVNGEDLPAEDVTGLLLAWRQGDPAALPRLMPLIYGELRRLAARFMAAERSDHTLEPTALVHEAYLRLAGGSTPSWQDRAHFFAVAAQLMRRLLVDHARARRRAKRGSGARVLPLDAAAGVGAPDGGSPVDLLALDRSLTDLAGFDDRKARIVELRFFGGLTIAETAEVLGVSTATVILEARLARAWLFLRIAPEGAPRAS